MGEKTHKVDRAKFLTIWLHTSEFKPWLSRVESDPRKAYCLTCNKYIGAELTTLRRHKISQIHLRSSGQNFQEIQIQQKPSIRPPIEMNMARILFACLFADHNLPFMLADSLVDLIQVMFPDSVVAHSFYMRRTKCNEVIRSLGNAVTLQFVRKLQVSKFSIVVAETTDVSKRQICCVIVRYFDVETHTMQTGLLDLLNLSDVAPTGESLYNALMNCLSLHKIPTENLIGFAANGEAITMFPTYSELVFPDGSLIMVANEQDSLTCKLKGKFPGIVSIKCACYSIEACVSEGVKTLPECCEEFLGIIYSFFSKNKIRRQEFRQYQEACQVEPHDILIPIQNCCASLHEAVGRVLEQWQPLKMYFASQEFQEGLAQRIIERLSDPSLLCYFNFLDFILPCFSKITQLFQRDSPTIHLLYENVCELYKNLLSCFCVPEVLEKDLMTVDPINPENHMPESQIYLGTALHSLFQEDDLSNMPEIIEEVRYTCRTFLITVCLQMKKKFDFNCKLAWMASFLSPKKMLDARSRQLLPSLYDFVRLVPLAYDGDIQTLDREWRNLSCVPLPDHLRKCSLLEFYDELRKIEDNDNNKKFSNLANFAIQILSLPTSTGDSKKIIADLNFMKTNLRNCMQLATTTALLIFTREVKAQGGCLKFVPTQEMLDAVR